MTRHPDDLDLLALASGTLGSDHPLTRHVSGCVRCRIRITELVSASAVIPAGAWRDLPPPRPPVLRTRWGGPTLSRLAIATGLGTLVTLAVVFPRLLWRGPTPDGLTSLAILTAARSEPLSPVGAAYGTLQVTYASDKAWVYLTGSGLEVPSRGRTYELWWVFGANHIRAGTFRPDADGAVALWLKAPLPAGGIPAIGVTLEPAGGTSRPTGPRIFYALLEKPRATP